MNVGWQSTSSAQFSAGLGLSIVIPVYRGALTIGHLVEALSGLQIEGGLEIILVNDGSPDDSGDVCRTLVRTAPTLITYVEHTRNFGEQNAVMTGLRLTKGAYVITMDDDLQNPPEEIVRLYDYARLNGWDAVYARYALKHHSAFRNLGSRFANWVADRLFEKPRGLYLSSFRCISATVVQEIIRYVGPFPYVDGLVMQVTQRVSSIDIRHDARTHGRSNYTLRRLLLLWLDLATSFSLVPLRLAIFIGGAMTILGMLGAVFVFVDTFVERGLPSGWASTMILVLLIGGVQSMLMAVLGEYVGRTFLTAYGKPQAAIRGIEYSASADPKVTRPTVHGSVTV
jgi:undecaprenyl-phosphate 4-deoxy-4-formamido-L-arabinose transferase